MGALSRRKGRAWEQALVRMLKPIFGEQVKRGLAQSRFGASEAPDVNNVPGWWVEAKHGQLVNLRAALEQASTAMAAAAIPGDTRRPVAFCKDNRSRPVAVLYLDDFLALLQEWHQATHPTIITHSATGVGSSSRSAIVTEAMRQRTQP